MAHCNALTRPRRTVAPGVLPPRPTKRSSFKHGLSIRQETRRVRPLPCVRNRTRQIPPTQSVVLQTSPTKRPHTPRQSHQRSWWIVHCCELLENSGLRAEVQLMPALERVDGLAGHHAHVLGFEIEHLGRRPLKRNDRIKRRWHRRS